MKFWVFLIYYYYIFISVSLCLSLQIDVDWRWLMPNCWVMMIDAQIRFNQVFFCRSVSPEFLRWFLSGAKVFIRCKSSPSFHQTSASKQESWRQHWRLLFNKWTNLLLELACPMVGYQQGPHRRIDIYIIHMYMHHTHMHHDWSRICA